MLGLRKGLLMVSHIEYDLEVNSLLDKITIDMLLSHLDEVERETIILWYREGLTLNEIAIQMSNKYTKKKNIISRKNKTSSVSGRFIGQKIRETLQRLRKIAVQKS